MIKRNKNLIQCDFCNSLATINFQKVWKKFIIDKNGDYKEDKNFDGGDFEQSINEDNIHLCKRHLTKWLKGKI